MGSKLARRKALLPGGGPAAGDLCDPHPLHPLHPLLDFSASLGLFVFLLISSARRPFCWPGGGGTAPTNPCQSPPALHTTVMQYTRISTIV